MSNISDPVNLNPAQSSSILKKVLDGKLNSKGKSPNLQVEFQEKNTEKFQQVNSKQLVLNNKRNSLQNNPVQLLPPLPAQKIIKPTSIDPFTFKEKFPSSLENLLKLKEKFYNPKFRCDVPPESAKFNFDLLKSHEFNLDKLLNPKNQCATNYGSEFKAFGELEKVFGLHPCWSSLKQKLKHGCDFPVDILSEDERIGDVEGSFVYGNHKSASKHEKFLSDSMIKEVKKGWGLLLLEKDAKHIPGLELSPMGVAEHLGINDEGNYVPKKRITHDLSWEGISSKKSLNSRIDKEKLEPIMFGHCLLRVIHYIVALRKKYPNKVILIRKEDLKSAYRRMHLSADSAKRAAIRVKLNGVWYVIISLRLPFGGSSCPADFCLLSDIIADSVNDLLSCDSWDERVIHSSFVKNIPDIESLDDKIPFAEARELLVDFPVAPGGKCDVFIDDLITCAVHLARNVPRIVAAPCTIIHALAKQYSDKVNLPRDDLIELGKCIAEGAPSEAKICLGWLLNTRTLKLSLPRHKFLAWIKELQSFIDNKSCSLKSLESMIGKLENVISVFKIAGHFMNNIYTLKLKAERKSQHNVFIPHHVKADFVLHKKILKMVYL